MALEGRRTFCRLSASGIARIKQEVLTFLGDYELLKNLFTCHCDGVTKRAAIARRLQAGSNVVKNAQKRLERRNHRTLRAPTRRLVADRRCWTVRVFNRRIGGRGDHCVAGRDEIDEA